MKFTVTVIFTMTFINFLIMRSKIIIITAKITCIIYDVFISQYFHLKYVECYCTREINVGNFK